MTSAVLDGSISLPPVCACKYERETCEQNKIHVALPVRLTLRVAGWEDTVSERHHAQSGSHPRPDAPSVRLEVRRCSKGQKGEGGLRREGKHQGKGPPASCEPQHSRLHCKCLFKKRKFFSILFFRQIAFVHRAFVICKLQLKRPSMCPWPFP